MAIYKTYLSREFDATNVIPRLIITVVTSIIIDYIKLLGPTVEKIVWYKLGIFKPGSLGFSTFQLLEVTAVL